MISEEKKILQAIENMANSLPKGVTIAQIQDCSKENLESLYAVGRNLYTSREYKKALEVFKFLVMYDHMDGKYWFALGSTAKALGDYATAVSALSASSLIEFTPKVGFLMTECFLYGNDTEGAIATLKTIINFGKDSGDNESIEKANIMLESINKVKQPTKNKK